MRLNMTLCTGLITGLLLAGFPDLAPAGCDHYPKEVLDGTELVEIHAFSVDEAPTPLQAGRYSTEMGGALGYLEVRVHGQALSVRRIYAEAGLEPQIRDYRGLVAHADSTFRSSTATLKTLPDGSLLFWEQASGLEFLPNDFWIRYQRD